jgi:hypothetical protein
VDDSLRQIGSLNQALGIFKNLPVSAIVDCSHSNVQKSLEETLPRLSLRTDV